MTSSRSRLSWGLLAVGLAAACLVPLLPAGLLNGLCYLAVTSTGVAMTLAGALASTGSRRRVWMTLAVGQAVYLVGDALWVLYDHVLHIDPYPSPADVAYLLWYPIVAVALLGLTREHHRGAGRAAVLDAAIIGTGLTILGVEFLVLPSATAGGGALLDRAVAAAYPVGDLLLMAVLIAVFTSGTARGVSFWALVCGFALTLVADVEYVLLVVSGGDVPRWLDVLWLAGILLLGFAALHPSASESSEPRATREGPFTLLRLVLLGLALALGPVTEMARDLSGHEGTSPVVVVGGLLSITLVVVRMADLVRALQVKTAQLEALARSDSLTGVANRRTWDHELERALGPAGERRPLAVAVIDLDHFKRYNDTHGHVLGDLVLKETAAIWADCLDHRGFLARYGGEEFAVILRDAGVAEAASLLDLLRASTPHGQTCSVGFALWDGEESADALVSRADLALYHAKHQGRDRVAFHDGVTVTGSDLRAATAP